MDEQKYKKGIEGKNYGSIPHLPGSRLGPADRHCNEGQARIATEKCRQGDIVIVQEKLDGSNVGVYRQRHKLIALTRNGYLAKDSDYLHHRIFAEWVTQNAQRFLDLLADEERLVGEWMAVVCGTIYAYDWEGEPFVALDIMKGKDRVPYDLFSYRIGEKFRVPLELSWGEALSIEEAISRLGEGARGKHEAIGGAEGAVWRVERDNKVDFLVKYVQPQKVDGYYLVEKKAQIWQVPPNFMEFVRWRKKAIQS